MLLLVVLAGVAVYFGVTEGDWGGFLYLGVAFLAAFLVGYICGSLRLSRGIQNFVSNFIIPAGLGVAYFVHYAG